MYISRIELIRALDDELKQNLKGFYLKELLNKILETQKKETYNELEYYRINKHLYFRLLRLIKYYENKNYLKIEIIKTKKKTNIFKIYKNEL